MSVSPAPPAGLVYLANPANYQAGIPIQANLPAGTGGRVDSYYAIPALPTSLVLDSATGVITGTPTALGSGAYTVTATNSGGSTSATLIIHVSQPPPPTISVQPVDQTIFAGEEATFTVTASGTGPLGYQWRMNGISIATGTSDFFTTAPEIQANNGVPFSVFVSDGYGGSVTSSPATLLVLSQFTGTGSLIASRGYHTATLLPNGKVLVVGGRNGNAFPFARADAELYDPTTARFERSGTLAIARPGFTATLLPNGNVLLAGGLIRNPGDPSAEVFDSATGTFSVTGNLGTLRMGHTATLLPNGDVLLAGGAYIGDPSTSAELYTQSTGTFAPTGSLMAARSDHTATLMRDGKVLLAGGGVATAELYDATTGTFSATGSMGVARSAHTATLLPNGKVLLAGGGVASAELYDPATGTCAPTGTMATARSSHTATLLPNGKVLVTEGTASWDDPYREELYDPITGTFGPTGNLAVARSGHTATLLPNGKVLVAGGYGGSGYLASAELYDPHDPTSGTLQR